MGSNDALAIDLIAEAGSMVLAIQIIPPKVNGNRQAYLIQNCRDVPNSNNGNIR